MEVEDQNAKNTKKEKKKLSKKSKKVDELCDGQQYEECLIYISKIEGNPMRNLKIYENAILCNFMTGRYQEALTLIGLHMAHGHSEKSFKTLYREAVCNLFLSKNEDAYRMFTDLLNHNEMNDEIRQCCTDSIKEIVESEPKIKESANRKAEQQADQQAEQLIKEEIEAKRLKKEKEEIEAKRLKKEKEEIEANKPSSSSTSSSTSKLDHPSSTSTSKLDPPSLTSKADSPVGVVESSPIVADSPVGAFESNLLVAASSSVACSPSSSQKTAEPESLLLSENMLRRNILKSEFLVQSSLGRNNLYIVQPIIPIQVFFERKLADFKSDNKKEWWEYISECFRKVFRGIICDMFAIHSLKRACGDLDSSMYVTDDGHGRIFCVGGELFSKSKAQKDLDYLLSTMEAIVTLINPRTRTDPEAWDKEFVDSYKLPYELYHFFTSLRDKKVSDHMIQTTLLIDHPFFWPLEHKSYFIRILNDVFRQGLIEETMFTPYFSKCTEIKGWKSIISKDKLFNAIYAFKGDNRYGSGSETYILRFILAVLNHANDHDHKHHRGHNTKLTPVDIALRINKVFPKIYTILYDAMCSYANDLHGQTSDELDIFLQTVERCSSLRQ